MVRAQVGPAFVPSRTPCLTVSASAAAAPCLALSIGLQIVTSTSTPRVDSIVRAVRTPLHCQPSTPDAIFRIEQTPSLPY